MIATSILQQVEPSRLLKATEGLVNNVYIIIVTEQGEAEIRGLITNGDGTEYGVVLTEASTFCSCRDAMFRKGVCKHAVILALHAIRHPQATPAAEARPPDLKLAKVRPST
jgi:hypothetical protein